MKAGILGAAGRVRAPGKGGRTARRGQIGRRTG
jgi:hypothetical protein